MSRIFLSHSNINETEAIEIKDWIETNGWAGEVFLDLDPKRGLVAGMKWEAALKEAVHRCEAVLPLISKDSLESKWCLSEIGTARLLGKYIIPIIIDNTDVSALPADMMSEQIIEKTRDPHWEIRLKQGLERANLDPKTFPFEKGRRPYPGLESLTEQDAAIFFGRDAQIVRGLDRLRTLKESGIARLMVILGASGSGKSSFLRAGLWPRLDRDDRNYLPMAVIRPELAALSGKFGLYQALAETASGNRNRKSYLIENNFPINRGDINQSILEHGLQSYLAGLREASRILLPDGKPNTPPTVVLSVDQAEELFDPRGRSEADLFLDILTKTLSNDHLLIVVLAIRSDAYAQMQTDPRLTKISQNEGNLFNLAPMQRGSYRVVIEGPAKFVTPKPLNIEPQLTEALLEDSSGADALPLLAFTLERLFENFGKDDDLTLIEYKRMGRLEGAIEAAVNDSCGKALKRNIVKDKSEFEKAIKEAFIPHLTDVNDVGQFVRRVAPVGKLPSYTHAVINLLTDQHLLIKDRRRADNGDLDIVEIAHEALLREWPLLRGWLEEEKDNIRAIGAVSRSAFEWERNGWKDEWLVHTGERLNEVMKLINRDYMKNRFGDLEKKYLKAAIDKVESDRREQEEQQKREQTLKDQFASRKKWVVRISVAACVVAIILGTFAFKAYISADEERTKTQNILAKKYWANALYAKEQKRWLRLLHYGALAGELATKGLHIKNIIISIQTQLNNILINILKHENAVRGAVFTKDETRILTWSDDGTARLWDAKDGSTVGQPMEHDDSINGAVFNKDETRILTWGGARFSRNGTVQLWDAKDGSPIGQPIEIDDYFKGAAFNKDESQILTWSGDNKARLWDVYDGSPAGQLMEHDYSIKGAVFNKDETRILTWGGSGIGGYGSARLWDAIDGSSVGQPMEHEGGVGGAAFNEDGTRIMTWGVDGARLWNAIDGSSVGQPMEHEGGVGGAVLNKDETQILTWGGARFSRNGTVQLWDAKDGSSFGQPMKHNGNVNGAMFNKDETRVLTWSDDDTARLWDAKDGSSVGQPMKHDSSVLGAIFNNDMSRILTWSGDDTARLWDCKNGFPVGQPMKHDDDVNGTVFNKDGSRILTWSDDGTARLWSAKDDSLAVQPMKHNDDVNGTVFNKDETRILTWSDDGTARLWDAKDGSTVGQPMEHDDSINGAVFNKDETRILTWGGTRFSRNGTVQLWDAKDGSPIGQPMKAGHYLEGAFFNRDESQILTWGGEGARLWDVLDRSPVGQPMRPDGHVNGAVFNKEGTRILTWSDSNIDDVGTAQLWDTKDGSPIGQPMKAEGDINVAVFNKDETRILTWGNTRLYGDTLAQLWDAKDGSLVGQPIFFNGIVNVAMFNKDETRILTWSSSSGFGGEGAQLWDAKDGSPVGQPMRHGGYINGAVFSKDGTRILIWGDTRAYVDSSAQLWDAKDGSPVGQPMRHGGYINGAAFGRDETRILTWGGSLGFRGDGIARLWDAKDGSPVGPPMKHGHFFEGAVFNKDETRILTWSEDGTARLWNAKDGSSFGQPMRHDDNVNGAVFNKEGTRILTWSGDGAVRLWNIEADEEFPNAHLHLMVKVATGASMDDYGNIITLSKKVWEKYKADYILIAKRHIRTCKHKDTNIYLKYQKPFWNEK